MMSLQGTRSFGIAAVAAAAVLCSVLPGKAAELDRVAAVVNGDAILASEVERRSRHLAFDLRQTSSALPSRAALIQRSLDELVLERLQLGIAESRGLQVTDETLDRALETIARRHGATVDDLRRSLEAGSIPFSDFRDRIRNDLLVESVRRREVFNRIEVSEAEIDRYLAQPDQTLVEDDEFLVGHILIARSQDEAASRNTAEEVLARLQAGEAFVGLARLHSSGARAGEGGILDWRPAAALPSLVAGLVPRLEPGETSGIIEDSNGFHIFKLMDVRRAGQNFVRQTHAAHILVTLRALVSDEDARLRLVRLRERILQGEEFEELARFHSDDSASAVRGGDLGWLGPGAVTPRFQAELDRLQPGELSEPFKSTWGWHIVRVLERREHDNTDEVRRARARNAIFQRKANEELIAWLRQLRDSAFVKLRVGE
ncbi:MAG: peptidylprolyl isomerase [Immundisolibacterales bacterium]|nr:peptidylprolyl isomerase [Immundisolibacterales bacterium]